MESVDFTHSSRKPWQAINKLTGRSTTQSRCPVTVNAIASQLLNNGRFPDADGDFASWTSREVIKAQRQLPGYVRSSRRITEDRSSRIPGAVLLSWPSQNQINLCKTPSRTDRVHRYVSDPGEGVKGEDLIRKQWTTLNRLRTTGVGRYKASMKKWGLADSAACECGEPEQTADNIINSCPLDHHPKLASSKLGH